MSAGRSLLGAALGAAVATVGLRINAHAKRRNARPLDVLADLPDVLADDAKLVADAARGAFADGLRAAERARIEFDMQVVANARRNKSPE